jgi:hypothetical protein
MEDFSNNNFEEQVNMMLSVFNSNEVPEDQDEQLLSQEENALEVKEEVEPRETRFFHSSSTVQSLINAQAGRTKAKAKG